MRQQGKFILKNLASLAVVGVFALLAAGSLDSGDSGSGETAERESPTEQCLDAWPAIATAINDRRKENGLAPVEGLGLIPDADIRENLVKARPGECVFDYGSGPTRFVEKKSGIGAGVLWEFAEK